MKDLGPGTLPDRRSRGRLGVGDVATRRSSMSEVSNTSTEFDTALARELTTFENEPTLEQALKWRLNEACDEIDRLREDLQSAEDHIDFIMGEIGGTLPR